MFNLKLVSLVGVALFVVGSLYVLSTSRVVVEEKGSFYPEPLSKHQLGRNTWSYLHTMATMFPLEDDETEEEKLVMIDQFLRIFAKIFPCPICGKHFEEMLQRTPPPTKGTRKDLEIWLCERHNEVNKRLGKQIFDCTLETIRASYEQTDGCPIE